jgi:hypothetical protein
MLTALVLSALPTVLAAPIKPASWSAVSSATAAESENYEPTNLGDAKQSTSWIEGEQGSGLGAWVQAGFDGDKSLTGFTIWPGYWYNFEYWQRYARPKTIVVEFSDGSSQEFAVADSFKPQSFTFSAPKKTSSARVKVKAVYAGSTFPDFAISELVFRDAAPERGVAVKAFAASSTFPSDGDGNYEPANMQDGVLDSMWCEGKKDSDGANEWVEFTFGGATSISKLALRNGSATSLGMWMKSNRATGGTLTFSDGSTESVVVKDTMSEQVISFPAHTTSKVRLTFTTVNKGKEFNDLCVSEAIWME